MSFVPFGLERTRELLCVSSYGGSLHQQAATALGRKWCQSASLTIVVLMGAGAPLATGGASN